MREDTRHTFDEIRASCPTSLLDNLLQAQRSRGEPKRNFDWTNPLRCLTTTQPPSMNDFKHLRPPLLFQTRLRRGEKYAIVSYAWQASSYEDDAKGHYTIVNPKTRKTSPSGVRNVILERVLKYLTQQRLTTFWIDRECLDQRCFNQSMSRQKEAAIQTMDVLYRRNTKPIGVLSTPIERQDDLILLANLLRGNLISQRSNNNTQRLAVRTDNRALETLIGVLFRIVCDLWWTRRWIFQEEYCASSNMRMHLLLPCANHLCTSDTKDVFGQVHDELVINAARFRKQVTLFCIACRAQRLVPSRLIQQFDTVLSRAKSYKIWRKYGHMLKYGHTLKYGHMLNYGSPGQSLSTQILLDVCLRLGSVPVDALAIIANCCGYPSRLKKETLQKLRVHSLSITLLALLLLNGEIFRNDVECSSETIVDFVESLSLRDIQPPTANNPLTFMKRCRFVNVRLCKAGVKTTGYLWVVRDTIKSRACAAGTCYERFGQRTKCLNNLINELEVRHPRLAADIKKYRRDGHEILREMLDLIIKRTHRGLQVVVAHSVKDPRVSGLFVSTSQPLQHDQLIFTAFEEAESGRSRKKSRFLDKFVSLAVVREAADFQELPCLRTQAWVNGFWLPHSKSSQDVLFPWHSSFTKIFST